MNRITISMPEQMNEWVESQIASGRYGNTSEYFRDLVRHDQQEKQVAIEQLKTMMKEAEQSGRSDKTFDEIINIAKEKAISLGASE